MAASHTPTNVRCVLGLLKPIAISATPSTSTAKTTPAAGPPGRARAGRCVWAWPDGNASASAGSLMVWSDIAFILLQNQDRDIMTLL